MEIGEYVIGKVAFLEVLLAQDAIIGKMDNIMRIDLLAQAIEKNNEKSQYQEIYGIADTYTAWIAARVLQYENYAPLVQKMEEIDELRNFVSIGSLFTSYDQLNEVISMAREFLSQTKS